MFKAGGQSQFDKLLEKATSNLLLEPDWASIIQICDLIRQKDCQPKYAITAIKKKVHHPNPHVSMFALQVLESVVKNCGSPAHDEVATKSFMEELRDLAKTTQHENVRDKILELVQTWAHAFRKLPTYRAVQDTLNIMKTEGAKFPPLAEADAMFVSDTAPEWADSTTCHRCRVEFGIMVRKHHCRACGQVFCGKCSNKSATLPKFGIEKEVRVCDACFEKVTKMNRKVNPNSGKAQSSLDEILKEVMAASKAEAKSQQQRKKTEEELQEEEQLQLAIAISQSEAEAKERESRYKISGSSGLTSSASGSSVEQDSKGQEKNSALKSTAPSIESDDPELSRYLNRTYWESRHTNAKDEEDREETIKSSSLPNSIVGGKTAGGGGSLGSVSFSGFSQFQPSAPVKENKDKMQQPPGEVDSFVDSLRAQIETFVTRMKSNSSRGRFIANDTAVQSLFMNITALHSQLLNFIQAQDNARTYYEGLQDKLSQVRDARAALDALRDQHRERLRVKAEEEERAKRFHMAQMLQIKRQQKQEYLEYQRQLTLQRMQEQEREMQMRIEHQKQQLIQQGQFGMYNPSMPGYVPPQHGADMNHYMHQSGEYMPQGNLGIVGDQNQPGANVMRYPVPTGPGAGQPSQFIPPTNMQPMQIPSNHQQHSLPPHVLQQSHQQIVSHSQGGIPHTNSQLSLGEPHGNHRQLPHGPSQQQPPPQQMMQPPQPVQPQPHVNQVTPQPQYMSPQQPLHHLASHGIPVSPNPSMDTSNNAPAVNEEPSTAELISFD